VSTRYRIEDGHTCIDLHVRRIEQLFDGRDPAPFRERDLDEDAVDYLVGASEELPTSHPLKVIVSVDEPLPPGLPASAVVEAFVAHFAYEEVRLAREIRRHVRRGQGALVIGLFGLVVCLALEELLNVLAKGHLAQVLKNGLVIIGWVAMWRPVEALLYDWWPLWSQRRNKRRLREAPCEVRVLAHASGERSSPGE